MQSSLDQPGGSSKLCLSCHDGTLAIGNVNVLNGQANASITMQGTGPGGVMPAGAGDTTGFTRYLGTDLRNDHPISLTYNSALADRDGELRPVDANQRWPADGSVVGVRAPGYKPKLPLEPTGGGCATGRCSAPPATTRTRARSTHPKVRKSSCASIASRSAAVQQLRCQRHRLPVLPRQEPGHRQLGVFGARQRSGSE